jgi:hypothetical protein
MDKMDKWIEERVEEGPSGFSEDPYRRGMEYMRDLIRKELENAK